MISIAAPKAGTLICLTNAKAHIPNSIYSGAGTHLITDHNNELDQGYMHACRRVNAPPVKGHMLHVKVYEWV
jgi:hypothetical protein